MITLLAFLLSLTVFAQSGTSQDQDLGDFSEIVNDYVMNNLTRDENLTLELSEMATGTSNVDPKKFFFPESVNGNVTKIYYDLFSGFQAYRVSVETEEGQVIVYAFSATQLTEKTGPGYEDRKSLIDTRDWMANLTMGQAQIESLPARKLMADVVSDLKTGQKVLMGGQSLGGMVSHALAYTILLEMNEAKMELDPNQFKAIGWGIPGMKDMVEKFNHVSLKRKIRVDETLAEKYLTTLFFDIDILPRMGRHFGTIKVLPAKALVLRAGEKYAMDIPLIRGYLEAHLYPGFKRAITSGGIPQKGSEFKRRQVIFPKFVQGIARSIGYGVLKKVYLKALAKQGTQADWDNCYAAESWMTKFQRNCTSKKQDGCEVGKKFKRLVGPTFHEKYITVRAMWCLPNDETNPLLNARL